MRILPIGIWFGHETSGIPLQLLWQLQLATVAQHVYGRTAQNGARQLSVPVSRLSRTILDQRLALLEGQAGGLSALPQG